MPNSNYSKNIVYLSQAQYQELITNQTITVDGVTVTYNENDIYVTPQAEPVTDVRVAGTSVTANGVANIPYASSSNVGVVKTQTTYGTTMYENSKIGLAQPSTGDYKEGYKPYMAVQIGQQHTSTFYGLSKAAGIDLNGVSGATVGTYTPEAKGAIQSMLGVSGLIATAENNLVASKAYAVGDVFTANGKLYKVTTAIAAAETIVVQDEGETVSGHNAEETQISSEFAKKKDTVLETTLSRGRKADTTIGENSFAFGQNVEASGRSSVAFGQNSIASGICSLSQGISTKATGSYSNAEGQSTQTIGDNSHAEGILSIAKGSTSHAEGLYTIASGYYSHASGMYNVEDNIDSWSEWVAGEYYTAGTKLKTTINGKLYGILCINANNDTALNNTNWETFNAMNYAEIVGNGTGNNARSNAYALDWSGNGHYAGDVYVHCNADSTGGIKVPYDVQANGTSIVSNGVANIPIATADTPGIVKVQGSDNYSYGIRILSNGLLCTAGAGSVGIKGGLQSTQPIVPAMQHESTFYGLAKAAGDSTQSASSNAVGTYTTEALAAIHTMLGIDPAAIASQVDIPLIETISGTTPTITGKPNTRYNCGEVSTLTITPPSNGSMDVVFTSGTTATVLTVPNTVKFPAWFDATTLEADTIYEIIITDGIYGSVMTWAA